MIRSIKFVPLAALCVIFCTYGVATGDEAPPQVESDGYRHMPWHLTDVWWDLGKDQPFESFSMDVTIDTDIPEGVRLYVAPIGLGHLSGSAFYGGIQTLADATTRTDAALRQIGPGFLFSMWGERSLDAIRTADGGLLQSSGHEGDFVSVRRPYKWKKGAYTYRITRMDEEEVEGHPYTWVGAFVESHETHENLFIGSFDSRAISCYSITPSPTSLRSMAPVGPSRTYPPLP